MVQGTSWKARGTELAKITLALTRGDVRWRPRLAEWLTKNFDRTKFNQRIVNNVMLEHVKAGHCVRGQRNVAGAELDVWFSVELRIDGEDRFIKFCIEPDDDENAGLVVVSAHPPIRFTWQSLKHPNVLTLAPVSAVARRRSKRRSSTASLRSSTTTRRVNSL